jgi:RimJ/RimL family protein N-acetyltransferase
MIIREAKIEDLEDVFLWRNDPLTRSMSITSEQVSKEEHVNWFNKSLTNPNRKLYIGVSDKVKVGICRIDYDIHKNCGDVSINLNPQIRGKNLSYELLNNSMKIYWETNIGYLQATIKKENVVSTKIFKKCGFKQINEDQDFFFFMLNAHF